MVNFTKKEKGLIYSLLMVYNEYAQLDYIKTLNQKLWKKVEADGMNRTDEQRLYAYVQNISAMTVSAAVEDDDNTESRILNKQLLSILVKLEDSIGDGGGNQD